jgi:hypothetical protein
VIAWELSISNTEVDVYYFFILMDFFAKVKIRSLIFVKSYPHSSKISRSGGDVMRMKHAEILIAGIGGTFWR